MKIIPSLLIALFFSNLAIAQTTAIPDANFEQALINLGLDTGTIDGTVPTANIDTLTTLDVSSSSISDLTGIENFIALTFLFCQNGPLTSLDISNNTALEVLDCGANQLINLDVTNNTSLTFLGCFGNQITSLDVTNNSALETLYCNSNQLTTLDITENTALNYMDCNSNQLTSLNISQNTALISLICWSNQLTNLDVSINTALYELQCNTNQLTSLDVSNNTVLIALTCHSNQLTSLDLSKNIALTLLYCNSNQLNCLNIKNGNNTNFVDFHSYNNPNLNCIEVDNVAYSNTNWVGTYFSFDPASSFNTNCNNVCSTVGIEEKNLSNVSLYPNPTTGSINIDLEEMKSNISVRLTNALGQVLSTQNYKSNNHINFDLDTPKGIYFLQIETSNGELITRRIIKE